MVPLKRNQFFLFYAPLKLNPQISSERTMVQSGIISKEETDKTALLIG
jgi:hypothetical protein